MLKEWTVEELEAEYGYGAQDTDCIKFTRALDDIILTEPVCRDYDAMSDMMIEEYLNVAVTNVELSELLDYKPASRSTVVARMKKWLGDKGYDFIVDTEERTQTVRKI